MPKQTQTPWLDLVTKFIAQGAKALASPHAIDNAAARALGFENAEHEALAFLSSSWCNGLMEVIIGPGSDADRTLRKGPDDHIQEILDHTYGKGQVSITYKRVPTAFIRRTHRRKPGSDASNFIGPNILDRYEALILAEQRETAWEKVDKIVIELRMEGSNGSTVHSA